MRKTIIYARVYAQNQKDNLERQTEHLKIFCADKGYILDEVLSEIGSTINYPRKKYIHLCEEIASKKIQRVLLEYKDRLLRIGFEDFERFCKLFDTEIIVIDNSETSKTKQQEITEDIVSIVRHFSIGIYSNRKRKKIIEILQKELDITSEENTEE